MLTHHRHRDLDRNGEENCLTTLENYYHNKQFMDKLIVLTGLLKLTYILGCVTDYTK